jgi:translation initiation factor 4G
LRKQNWVPRNASNQVAPTTLAKIHEMAEKNKEQKEATAVKRGSSNRGPYIPNQYNNNMQRTGSYRGGRDHFHNNNNNTSGNNANSNSSADGWNTVGISSPVSDKPRVNELSNFGKTDRSRSKNNILGPSNSPFPSLARNKTNTDNKNSGDGRSSPAVNMFSALSDGDKTEGRKRPGEGRSSPAVNMFNALSDGDESSKTSQPSPKISSSDANSSANKLSDEVIKRKSKNIIEEYFNIRDKKELAECIKELDDSHYLELFAEETLTVVEKKSEDVDTMCDVVDYLLSENLIDKQTYVKAFKKFMEGYEDLVIDVPQAPKYVAKLLDASSITLSDEGTEEIFNHLN